MNGPLLQAEFAQAVDCARRGLAPGTSDDRYTTLLVSPRPRASNSTAKAKRVYTKYRPFRQSTVSGYRPERE
jgi:hypothetical protein